MKNIIYEYNITKETISLPFIWKKGRPKKFFFFGDSFTALHKDIESSWTLKVCDYFKATAYNWGIPGASEQSIFYTFAKNIDEKRDFTFIFHTHPQRIDRFFNLYGMPMNLTFYKKWDEMIKFPCIHLYWSGFNYKFQNGKTLFCTFSNSARKTFEDFEKDSFKNSGSLHHMSKKDNFLFADEVIKNIKTMVDSKT
jgi:hypothetical protein|tara:strand:- start:2065 stop:2652 length:588 start_codon:yes stop_codon:yes gene_type:complete